MSEVPNNNKYYAFISYSHRNDDWGAWLHKSLETYHPPKALIGKSNRDGKVPAKLAPIFQDVHELPTASDLGAMIKNALEQSLYLIVICSPASAKSIWVNEEILTYKRLGKADHILAIIVDGEPNATDMPGMEDQECFPPALRFQLDDDGNLSDQPAEPIAADARKDKGGKKNALMKLVAGLLGVNFDDLVQREKQRQKKRRLFAAGLSTLLVAGSLFTWNNFQQEQLKARQAKIDQLTSEAIKALDNDFLEAAMGKLSAALPPGQTDINDPVLNRSFAVLNRANHMQKQRSINDVNAVLSGLRVLSTGQLIAQDEQGDVHLFNENGEPLREFAGVIHTGSFRQTNYHLDKAESVLTVANIGNESATGEDGIDRYYDVFLAKRYDLQTGKLLGEVKQRVKGLADGMIMHYGAGKEKFYPGDGKYYLVINTEHDFDGNVTRNSLLLFDTVSGQHKNWLSIDAELSALRFVDGVGVMVETLSKTGKTPYIGGFYFARMGDNSFTELLPPGTVKACDNGQAVSLEDIGDKRIPPARFGITTDNKTILLLISDISGYRDHCLQSWDVVSLQVSPVIVLKNYKTLGNPEKENAGRVLALQPSLYRHAKYGNITSLTDARVYTTSNDTRSFIEASKYGPEIKVYLKTGEEFELKGHTAKVSSLAFNEKTGVLYSASEDNTLRTWKISPAINHGDTGLEDVDNIQLDKNTLLATEAKTDDDASLTMNFASYPVDSHTHKADFSRRTAIHLSLGKKLRAEPVLLMDGNRLGVLVYHERPAFRVVTDDKPLPVVPKNQFYLFDTRSGKQLAMIEHGLFTYGKPALLGKSAYFPLDGKVLALDLESGTTSELLDSLPDNYAIKQVATHGNQLLLVSDNREDDKPEERTQRVYLYNPGNGDLQLLDQQTSQHVDIEQSASYQRSMLTWDKVLEKDVRTIIQPDNSSHQLKVDWEETYSTSYVLDDDREIIYLVKSDKSVESYDYNGQQLGITYSTQSWFSPRLFMGSEYLLDSDSLLALDNKPRCDKLATIDGEINTAENGNYLRVNQQVFDLSNCEVIHQLSVDVFEHRATLSPNGLFTYLNDTEIVQVPLVESKAENFAELVRWQEQRLEPIEK